MKNTAALLAALIALSVPAARAAPPDGPVYGSFGIDLSARALNTRPGTDFWTHANGGWTATVSIDARSETAGVSLDMRNKLEADVRDIVDDMAAHRDHDGADQDGAGRQIGALYRSWMDEAGIEARGIAVLAPWVARIDAVDDADALHTLFSTPGYASPLDIEVDTDPADPRAHILAIGQGRLGMPRDYYLAEGASYDAVRGAYRAYVLAIQQLSGFPDATARTDAIVALETAMARLQWSGAASRDLAKMNREERRAALDTTLPGFAWDALLAPYGIRPDERLLVRQDSALAALGGLLAATPLATWKDYLRYRFVADHAAYLPRALADADFAFRGKTLGGLQAPPERWRRGVQLVGATLGNALGRIYVERHYPPATARQMRELVDDVKAAFRERIAAAAWMDGPTRRRALAKLDALRALVGGPRRFDEDATLRMEDDDLLGNMVRAEASAQRLAVRQLHAPVDRGLWVVQPQQMNAFYDQHGNAIVFPAAILRPPLFDPHADAAVNYGAIGVLIGHEMGHAFDDQGSQFGPDGRVENWWSDDAAQAFHSRGAALARQYQTYEALPGLHVDGKLTLGENMADLSGVEAAYTAYRRYQARHGKAKRIEGLSGEQRFFLAYAQGRRTVVQESALRQLMAVDTHAPPVFRVNGVLRNVDAWYRAFDVRPGDPLYLPPRQRIRIW
nr:M13 family metallopeptidase [uncultured Massilia sp.]